MEIKNISIFHYDIPLTEKIKISGRTIESRKGYLLILEDEKGSRGYGEISPLPGFDTVSMKACFEELAAFKRTLAGQEFSVGRINFHSDFFALFKTDKQYNPPVKTGIECALLMLLLNSGNKDALNKFNFNSSDIRVKLNGLYNPSPGKSRKRQLLYLKDSGFKTIKIKIGRMPQDMEIKRIRELYDFFNKNITIRLDGNRSLKYSDYMNYYRSLNDINIEYVEEPLAPDQTASYEKKEIKWPLALDESVIGFIDPCDPSVKDIPPYVDTVVLKPTYIAGLHNIIKFIAEANRANIKITLSSAFNTGITIAILSLITGLIDNHSKRPHGFDTYKYMKKDIINNRLHIRNGTMFIPGSFFTEGPHINFKMLREVDL